jgi:hypothetical protein
MVESRDITCDITSLYRIETHGIMPSATERISFGQVIGSELLRCYSVALSIKARTLLLTEGL